MAQEWYKVDNVAKVFLATNTRRDPRVFRISCTLQEQIDPELLNEALRVTAPEWPQFQVTLHRGLFWHYFESTDQLPTCHPEDKAPCAPLYVPERRNRLIYRVTYFGSRINLEMFHALTPKLPNAYHLRGKRLPYDQLQFFEGHLSAKEVLARAHELGVSLTSYLGASLMLAIYAEMPALERSKPIAISLPVNLRNYYPSETARNFFNSVYVILTLTETDTMQTAAAAFDAQLKEALLPENIKAQMDEYEKLEHIPGIRPVPLVVKNLTVKFFTALEKKHVTAVISNMGRVTLPDAMKPYIKQFAAFSSCEDLFTCVASYGDDLVLGTASSHRSTNVLRRLYRGFAEAGLQVTLYATEVEK